MDQVPESQLLQCPYEPSHRILKERFQVHLGRCRRSHPKVPKATCPFNASHILNKPELDWHVTICEDRQSFENFKYHTSTQPRNAIAIEPLMPEMDNSENWADDPDVPTYNPSEYTSKAPVLRQLQGVSKSMKKQFRIMEYLRLRALQHQ